MKRYRAIAQVINDITGDVLETGFMEEYDADNYKLAVSYCLYSHKLHNGSTYVGPSGGVVYCPKHGALTIIHVPVH